MSISILPGFKQGTKRMEGDHTERGAARGSGDFNDQITKIYQGLCMRTEPL